MGHRERKKPKKDSRPSSLPQGEERFQRWVFCDWVQINGETRNVIHDWLDGLPIEDKQAINTRLTTMSRMERWPDTWASDYHGWPGILELRMNINDTPYRPLGCYGPGPKRWQFTILVGATEERGKISRILLKQATERKRIITQRCISEHIYD